MTTENTVPRKKGAAFPVVGDRWDARVGLWAQAACVQVAQEQSLHTQLAQLSAHELQAHAAWLHVGQVQSEQVQTAQESVQLLHAHTVHSS